MAKQRLHYIDILKGMLIILVIIHHAPMVCAKFDNPYMNTYWGNDFIIAFFMPAWFVVTGYCSNFHKPFKQYLIANLKTIMLPCFCLYVLNRFISNTDTYLYGDSSWMTLSHWLNPGIRTWLREGGVFWFLSALFVSKMLIWCVEKFVIRAMYRYALIIFMLLLGVVLYQYEDIRNVWLFKHAFILIPFLILGELLKQHEQWLMNKGLLWLVLFVASVSACIFLGVEVPTITRAITINLINLPLFLYLTILGTFSVWWIAQKINECLLLEYMGQGSIVMYAFNYATLTFVADTVSTIIVPSSPVASGACFIAIIVVSLALLVSFYCIINRRPINVILGRF